MSFGDFLSAIGDLRHGVEGSYQKTDKAWEAIHRLRIAIYQHVWMKHAEALKAKGVDYFDTDDETLSHIIPLISKTPILLTKKDLASLDKALALCNDAAEALDELR